MLLFNNYKIFLMSLLWHIKLQNFLIAPDNP